MRKIKKDPCFFRRGSFFIRKEVFSYMMTLKVLEAYRKSADKLKEDHKIKQNSVHPEYLANALNIKDYHKWHSKIHDTEEILRTFFDPERIDSSYDVFVHNMAEELVMPYKLFTEKAIEFSTNDSETYIEKLMEYFGTSCFETINRGFGIGLFRENSIFNG